MAHACLLIPVITKQVVKNDQQWAVPTDSQVQKTLSGHDGFHAVEHSDLAVLRTAKNLANMSRSSAKVF